MIITLSTLRQNRAYKDQLDIFAGLFPDGMQVTQANVEKAAAAGIGFEWYALTFLRGQAYKEFGDYCSTIADWSQYPGGMAEYDRRLAVKFCQLAG